MQFKLLALAFVSTVMADGIVNDITSGIANAGSAIASDAGGAASGLNSDISAATNLPSSVRSDLSSITSDIASHATSDASKVGSAISSGLGAAATGLAGDLNFLASAVTNPGAAWTAFESGAKSDWSQWTSVSGWDAFTSGAASAASAGASDLTSFISKETNLPSSIKAGVASDLVKEASSLTSGSASATGSGSGAAASSTQSGNAAAATQVIGSAIGVVGVLAAALVL